MHDYSSLKSVDYDFTHGSKSLDKNSATQNYNINIFPNPANDIVNIVLPDLKSNEIVCIEAFDVIGKSVIRTNKEYSANVYRLNFSNISEGVYFIHVRIGDKTSIKKITIVK